MHIYINANTNAHVYKYKYACIYNKNNYKTLTGHFFFPYEKKYFHDTL